MRAVSLRLGVAVMVSALLMTDVAYAGRWEVRREVREGAREVQREKREAARELSRCTTRECARREIREGYREVNRERREARREVRREVREARREADWRGRDDDGRALLTGVIVGAAVVGVAAAVANAQDED